MKRFCTLIFLSAILLFTSVASASALSFIQDDPLLEPPSYTPANPLSVFRTMYAFDPFNIKVPTVVKIPIVDEMQFRQIAIQEVYSQQFIYNARQIDNVPVTYQVTSDSQTPNESLLSDRNYSTYIHYNIPAEGTYTTTWTLRYDTPVESNSLEYVFDVNSAIPRTSSLAVVNNGIRQILIATRPFTDNRLHLSFPETTAQEWILTLTYDQPIRIAELGLALSPQSTIEQYTLQFLARPGNSYRLYTDPAVYIPIQTEEYVSFSSVRDSLIQQLPAPIANPQFQPPDQDNDSIVDQNDNCPLMPNSNQADINRNSIGDACEDFDGDGVMNNKDNCPDHPNTHQYDNDGDAIGDQCDPDESRLTERLAWLPWAGIVLGFGIVLGLLKITMKKEIH